METVVISIGGSVLIPGEDDGPYISRLAATLLDLSGRLKLYVVVGGGRHARYYINVGRDLGASEEVLDELGILITRVNARLLVMALGNRCSREVPETVEGAVQLGNGSELVVMGGTTPGHTTDAVSLELALAVGASRFVNASAVDGIYTADPRKDPLARRIESMSFEELDEITGGEYEGAGKNIVLDPVATRLIVDNRLPTYVVDGRDMEALRGAIMGADFHGTSIK